MAASFCWPTVPEAGWCAVSGAGEEKPLVARSIVSMAGSPLILSSISMKSPSFLSKW